MASPGVGSLGIVRQITTLSDADETFFHEQFNFPGGDTFENIDFSYAQFWHSSFTNAVFMTDMAFTNAYNCEFKRCIFTFNHAYGVDLVWWTSSERRRRSSTWHSIVPL